jgi:hypothetical protein
MRFGIVEGEPGIFPDPVARVLRRLARPFRERAGQDKDAAPAQGDIPVEDARRDDDDA